MVLDKVMAFLGDDRLPWVGKLVANDGQCIRVHWFRSINNKLTNRFTPITTGGKPDEDTYQYKKLPVLLDWGFDLVDKKIPLNRVKVLETTFERINKSYRK